MMCTVLLFVVAVAYSGAVTAVGRRLPRPASVTAYGTALAIFIAVPLLPDPNAQVVDRVLLVVGAGRLLVHLAFMTALSGLLVTIVLATNRWSPRHRLVVSGASALTVGFVLLWLQVRALPLADIAAVLYGLRAGRPLPVLWMNIVMGAGIVYNAVWGLREFQCFLHSARRTYERSMACLAMVLYVLAGVAGTLTIVEAMARYQGVDMTVVQQMKTPFTAAVLALTAGVLVGQVWLLPLWRHRRQLLLRYVVSELAQLRNDLLNISAMQAELHLDIHYETYANRTIVETVATRCRAAGISPARMAIARMATSLLTFQRDNLLQDPGYGLITSWEELMEEAAAEIDQVMAATAWEKALRDNYVSQQVYILMFLVLDSREYREILLIDERPQIQPWHQQLADLIATVMDGHGHSTPRYAILRQRATPHSRLRQLCARLTSLRQ